MCLAIWLRVSIWHLLSLSACLIVVPCFLHLDGRRRRHDGARAGERTGAENGASPMLDLQTADSRKRGVLVLSPFVAVLPAGESWCCRLWLPCRLLECPCAVSLPCGGACWSVLVLTPHVAVLPLGGCRVGPWSILVLLPSPTVLPAEASSCCLPLFFCCPWCWQLKCPRCLLVCPHAVSICCSIGP